jgi:hypothetical protein
MEFGGFINLVREDPEVNPRLVLVNGAQGGRTADRWVDLDAPTWSELNARLDRSNVTPLQVQVAWVKQTLTRGGDFPEKALALQSDLEKIAQNLKTIFPNLQIVYFSSRTRSYTYWRGLSPEPVAFETGFSVRWMLEKQLNGDPEMNFDPSRGEMKMPYLSWGPYLWIDGENPRSDGRVWLQEDLASDCTHPSGSGVAKVAGMLLEFFKTDTTAMPWFLAQSPVASPSVPPPSVTAGSPTETRLPPMITPSAPVEPTAMATSESGATLLAPSAPAVGPTPERPLSPPGIPGIWILLWVFAGMVLTLGAFTALWIRRRK